MKLPSPTVCSSVARVRRLSDLEADIAKIDGHLSAHPALARLSKHRPGLERFCKDNLRNHPIRIWIQIHTAHELRP